MHLWGAELWGAVCGARSHTCSSFLYNHLDVGWGTNLILIRLSLKRLGLWGLYNTAKMAPNSPCRGYSQLYFPDSLACLNKSQAYNVGKCPRDKKMHISCIYFMSL